MKNTTHVGNVTIVIDESADKNDPLILMGRKRPKDEKDQKRKRKRIGVDHWVPAGGATEKYDKTQKHAAQRELRQETGLLFSLKSFKKVGILRGYVGQTDLPNWLVHIYLVNASGTKQVVVPNEEYVEMRWFHLSQLPFEKMLQGDKKWLPKIVKGKKLTIRINSNENADKTSSVDIQPVWSFN